MRGLLICILSLAIFLSSVYALNDTNSTYINGVTFYNILLASKPIGETDYPQVYFRTISFPTIRGEYIPGDIRWDTHLNTTKVNEIINQLLKEEIIIKEDINLPIEPYHIPTQFRFKDSPDIFYNIFPYGILVVYTIPQGKKLTIDEFHKEKIRFLNETTERLRDTRIILKLDLKDDYRCGYCDFESGFSYTYIVEISDENNETYRKLIGKDYDIIRDSRRNLTLLFLNESGLGRLKDVISIGQNSPPILSWYWFLASSDYNAAKIKQIKRKLEIIASDLDSIRNNLSGNLNSANAFSILENISMSKNDTIKRKLDILLIDIKSVDYFIRISKEIKNRHHTEWVDVLFGFIIDENINRSRQVNDLYEKYNMLENQRQDLFDLTVAVYSAALQKEGVSEQVQTSYKTTFLSILVVIGLSFLSIIFSIYSIWLQKKESENLHRVTKIQTESNKEYMERLINEIKKLKPEKQGKS